MTNKILLNDLLGLTKEELENTKIRFNRQIDENWEPTSLMSSEKESVLLTGQYWNYEKNKQFKEGQLTIGLLSFGRGSDDWLLFHVGKITKSLNVRNALGYEYETQEEYRKYYGRVIIRYKNKSRQLNRNAISVINDCEVLSILSTKFDNSMPFPGYENVDISWEELKANIEKSDWKIALQNQKGVYLIRDTNTGKMYVGSAYGKDMLLGRWRSYANTCHGGDVDLKQLDSEYIKSNFRYSILDVYKKLTDDQVIINRESHWKKILLTRKFGYNEN